MTGRRRALAMLVAGTALGTMAARRAATVATVRGFSMTPTLADGERVLALRCRRYRPGDVIVFRAPAAGRRAAPGPDPGHRIKRVAAVAGEPVPARQRQHPGSPVAAPIVPPGHLVVSGDHPASEDSRQLGFIPVRAVAGRIVPHRPAS